MKPRQVIVAVVALAVVVVLLVVFGRPRRSSHGAGELVDRLVVPGFVPDKARLIEITKLGSDTVRLRKSDEDWTVESAWGYPADAAEVASLLHGIEELRVRDVRSTRPASYAAFEVDDAGGVSVRVYDHQDDELAHVCVGKTIAYDRCFVRASGSNVVVEAAPNLAQSVGTVGPHRVLEQTFFVDKRVASFDENTVRRITLERPEGTVVLEKTEMEEAGVNPTTGEDKPKTVTKWMIRQPDEEEADQETCRTIVKGFSIMSASNIGGGKTPEECGLAPAPVKTTIEFDETSEAAPVTVLFGGEVTDANRYYAMTDKEGARIFVVSRYYRDLAMKSLDELRKSKQGGEDAAGADEGGRPSDDQPEGEGIQPETQ